MNVTRPLASISLSVFFVSQLSPAIGQTSLIELGGRYFDLRTDASEIVRNETFIPIRDVDWIWHATESDPDLEPTVIHIVWKKPSRPGSKFIWLPDVKRVPVEELVPENLRPSGYEMRGRDETDSSILFVPPEEDKFYGKCAYSALRREYTFCTVTLRYAEDIQIYVRIYHRDDVTAPNFRAVAAKAEAFVFCLLDVTAELKAGDWLQKPFVDVGDVVPTKKECELNTN